MLALGDVAKIFGVTTRTIRRWISSGALKAVRCNSRLIRVRREEVEKFIKARATV